MLVPQDVLGNATNCRSGKITTQYAARSPRRWRWEPVCDLTARPWSGGGRPLATDREHVL